MVATNLEVERICADSLDVVLLLFCQIIEGLIFLSGYLGFNLREQRHLVAKGFVHLDLLADIILLQPDHGFSHTTHKGESTTQIIIAVRNTSLAA